MSTQAESHDGLVSAGYVMAVLFPIGGMVAGIVLGPWRTGHALAICTLSVLVTVAWWVAVLLLLG